MKREEQDAIREEIQRIIFTLQKAINEDTGDYAEKKDDAMANCITRLMILSARIM